MTKKLLGVPIKGLLLLFLGLKGNDDLTIRRINDLLKSAITSLFCAGWRFASLISSIPSFLLRK